MPIQLNNHAHSGAADGNSKTAIPATFCILPWCHAQLNPEGSVKLCCRAVGSVMERNNAMSVYAYHFVDIWNSTFMKNVRHAMLHGKEIPDCALCYQEERNGQVSYRQQSNQKWPELLSLNYASIASQTDEKSYTHTSLPAFLQFNLGNLCNLKCRMCSSSYSSQIARDPVHSSWSPYVEFHQDGLHRWQDNSVVIDPTSSLLTSHGFYPWELHEELKCCWTNGDAMLELPVDADTKPSKITIKVMAYRPVASHGVSATVPLNIIINGVAVYSGDLPRGMHELQLDLENLKISGSLQIGLHSSGYTRASDNRKNGIALTSIKLIREKSGGQSIGHGLPMNMRFFARQPWYQQPSLIYGELLNDVAAIREVYFTGGEPLLSEEALDLLTYLIDSGVAAQVTIQMNSNCTQIPERWLSVLSRFKKVDFALSLDGMESCYEYIRYPAKWEKVSSNINLLKSLPNISMTAVPIVQSYNMLNLVDLCRYCDSRDIRFALMQHHGHRHLDVAAMPLAARKLAASRLTDYMNNDCRPENKATVQAQIHFIDSVKDNATPEVLREFMLFTNDLDSSRHQSFQNTHKELLGLIEAENFTWTAETRFFSDNQSAAGSMIGQPEYDAAHEHTGSQSPVDAPSQSGTDAAQQALDFCFQGERLFAENDPIGSEILFRKALDLDHECVLAYNNLGVLLWNSGAQAEALEIMQKAMQHAHNDRTSLLNYAGMLIGSKQRLQEASSLLMKYMLEFPGDNEVSALFLEIDN